jgi:ComF family protein
MIDLVRRLRCDASRAARGGLHLLFPPRCTYCDAGLPQPGDRVLLCAKCRRLLTAEQWSGCRRCGAAGVAADQPPHGCQLCRKTELHFDTAVPLGIYEGELREVVLRMKRPTQESLSMAMGRLLGLSRDQQFRRLKPDLVVPVPMHWGRRWLRAANSSEILAECLGRHLRIPAIRGVIFRCRKTLLQANLSPKERFQNVRGAFRILRGRDLKGARVLVADDVLTTGATCSEVAKMLKAAGATMVAAAILARARNPIPT